MNERAAQLPAVLSLSMLEGCVVRARARPVVVVR
jgi:hypothetical protein